MIIEKNSALHRKHMNKDIRLVPGVAKAFLTDSMRKLIKDYTNTGLISIEDAFEDYHKGLILRFLRFADKVNLIMV